MSVEVLVLGLFSGLRPGTSLAAVLALLKTPEPQRPLLFFLVAGFAWSWVIGLIVVGVMHGADLAIGGSTFTAIVDVAFGAAALGFAAGLQRGWVQPGRMRSASPPVAGTVSDTGGTPSAGIVQRLRNPSAGVAAAAGVGTHLPGLIYLAALNVIASDKPGLIGAGLRVAIYDVLWFLVPIASLALVVVRPGVALAYLEDATAWARRHEHGVLVTGSLVLGVYLLAKGTASLLT